MMPTTKVWASPGGITPMELNSGQLLTSKIVHEGERELIDELGPGDVPDQGPQQQPQGLEGDGPGPGDAPDHGLQQQQGLEGEEICCEISRNERMPSLEVWASPGGITPMELRVAQIITSRSLHEREMQQLEQGKGDAPVPGEDQGQTFRILANPFGDPTATRRPHASWAST